jgi:hypothetical protein
MIRGGAGGRGEFSNSGHLGSGSTLVHMTCGRATVQLKKICHFDETLPEHFAVPLKWSGLKRGGGGGEAVEPEFEVSIAPPHDIAAATNTDRHRSRNENRNKSRH